MAPFELTSSSDLVFFNGELVAVGEVYNDKAASDPTAQIAYHNVKMSAQTPGEFELELKHRIAHEFKTAANVEAIQFNFGTLMTSAEWISEVAKQIWHMRWIAKGLAPMKPAVHLLGEVTLQNGRVVNLTGNACP